MLLDLCDQIGLFDVRERDIDGRFGHGLLCLALLLDGREVDREYTVCESRQTALPLPVLVDRSKGLEFDQTALKPGEVFGPEELSLQARRRDLQGVLRPRNEVFDVEYCATPFGSSDVPAAACSASLARSAAFFSIKTRNVRNLTPP